MFNDNINLIQSKLNKDLKTIYTSGPKSLVDTFNYVISGEGKRVRPLLTILTSESLFEDFQKSYNAALAIEILHNFTLVHDDIMDNDSIRHGKETVHKKWDNSTAILTGDLMLAKSLKILSDSNYSNKVMKSFNSALVAVCEGQALDKEFEALESISENDYFNMIEKKTSNLIAMPIEIGALAYNHPDDICNTLFEYGLNIGKAFQINDDYLEIISSSDVMQKSLDSDILLGKKTYPIILCNNIDKDFINDLKNNSNNIKDIINELRIFIQLHGIDKEIKNTVDNFYQIANKLLDNIKFKNNKLTNFVNLLKKRQK